MSAADLISATRLVHKYLPSSAPPEVVLRVYGRDRKPVQRLERNALVMCLVLCFQAVCAADPDVLRFQKVQISEQFWSEGTAIADINGDGHTDIVAGPFWYEGPEFKVRHEIFPATQTFKRAARRLPHGASSDTLKLASSGLRHEASRYAMLALHTFVDDDRVLMVLRIWSLFH